MDIASNCYDNKDNGYVADEPIRSIHLQISCNFFLFQMKLCVFFAIVRVCCKENKLQQSLSSSE